MPSTPGGRIKKLRIENNYTQKQVTDYLGCEQSQIAKLENDNMVLKSSSLNKLCELYDCALEFILEGSAEYYLEPISYENELDLHTVSHMNRIIRNLKRLNELNGLK